MIIYHFFNFKEQAKESYLESVRQLCITRIYIIVFVRKFEEMLLRNISSRTVYNLGLIDFSACVNMLAYFHKKYLGTLRCKNRREKGRRDRREGTR